MQKNQIIEAKIESLSHDGRGISIINGKTTFITGALAKETVSCQDIYFLGLATDYWFVFLVLTQLT